MEMKNAFKWLAFGMLALNLFFGTMFFWVAVVPGTHALWVPKLVSALK